MKSTSKIRRLAGWFLSQPAGMFYCLLITDLHSATDSPPGYGAFCANLAAFFFPSCMAAWVFKDARQRQLDLPFDFGAFIFFGWPVVVPVYLFRTRGQRAFATIGRFLLLWLTAILGAAVMVVIREMSE